MWLLGFVSDVFNYEALASCADPVCPTSGVFFSAGVCVCVVGGGGLGGRVCGGGGLEVN